MACQLHGDRPRPSLCHDCARAQPAAVQGIRPELRILEQDRGVLRIIPGTGRGNPTKVVKR